MTMQASTAPFETTGPPNRPSAFPVQSAILSGLLVLVPALVFLNRGIVWPMMYGDRLLDTSGLFGGLGEYSTHLLHKIWFPTLAALAMALFAIGRVRNPVFHMRYMVWWVILYAWSAISVLWAIEPTISLSRLILQLLVAGCIFLAFAGTNRPRDIVTSVYWVVMLSVVLNLVAVLTQQPTPLGYRGIFQHKNVLGPFAVVAVFFILLKLRDGPWYSLAAFAGLPVCMFLLIASQSKTSLGLIFIALSAGVVIALFAWGLRIPAMVTFIAGCAAAAVASMGLSAVAGLSFTQQLQALTGDATLTGRTDIWSFAWPYVEAQPWIGYGFRSFWQIGENSPSLSLGFGFIATVWHGHNGYLDIVLGGGIIGLLTFLPLLIISLNLCGAIGRQRPYEGAVLAAFVVFTLLHNLLETTFLFGVNVMFVLYQIIWLYMVYTVRSGDGERAQP